MTPKRHPGLRYVTPIDPSRPNYARAVGVVTQALLGSEMMPWQHDAAHLQTEMLPDGSWAYQSGIISVQRQAGKTGLRGPMAIHRCLSKPFSRCWLTAQTRQDARDIVVEEVGRRFELSALRSLAKLRESQGSEGLYFKGSTGSSWRAFAPDEGGLDGKANEMIDVDELWKIKAAVGAALDNSIQPTTLTTGGQFVGTSTAGTAASTWLLGKVLAGREAWEAGAQTGTFIVEYGVTPEVAEEVRALILAKGVWSTEFDRAVELLAMHYPSYGYTLRLTALAAGIRQMMSDTEHGGIDSVLRAYGNYWSRAAQTLIPLPIFDELAKVEPAMPIAPRAALGVAVGMDAADTVTAAAWRHPDTGRPMVRILDELDGTAGADEVLATRRRARPWTSVACAGAGPVLEVVDAAERRHRIGKVTRLTDRDVATASAQALTYLLAQVLWHDGNSRLRNSVRDVAKRRIADGGWAFGRGASEGSIAALEAATVALYALDHAAEWEDPEAL